MCIVLRVNMADETCVREELPAWCAGMGGRGLASMLLAREASPGCAPLGEGNKLIFSPGLLSAVGSPSRDRLAASCIIPQTGLLKSSTSSALAANHLARLGILAVIIEKAAPPGRRLQLEIRPEQAGLVPAQWTRRGSLAVMENLRRQYGEACSCMVIGPAGESLVPFANIACLEKDGRGPRFSGQGGMGAVMGAKGLKSIVVLPGAGKVRPIRHPAAFARAAPHFAAALDALAVRGRQAASEAGDTDILAAGALPEGGHGFRHSDCRQGCGLCGPFFADRQKKRARKSASYRALWNSLAGEDGHGLRERFDRLCDEIGVDAFAASAALASGMARGLPDRGDGAALLECIRQTGDGNPPPWLRETGSGAWGKTPPEKAATGREAGGAARRGSRGSAFPAREDAAFADSMGFCAFAAKGILQSPEAVTALAHTVNAVYGWTMSVEDVLSLGRRVLQAEEAFNA